MKIKELRDLTKEELLQKENTFKQELFNLNYERRFGRVEKPHKFKELKRSIARIHALLKEKIDASPKEK